MGQKREKFLRELKERNKYYRRGEFKVIGEYINTSEKVEVEDKYGKSIISCSSLLYRGSKPSLVTAKNKTEYFKNMVFESNKYYREGKFEIVGEYKNYNTHIRVKNSFGECLMSPYQLKELCYEPTIKTAIDKTSYFKKRVKKANKKYLEGKFEIIGNYKGAKHKIKIKGEYGICNVKGSHLLDGFGPNVGTAENKGEYFMNRLRKENPKIYKKVRMKSPFIKMSDKMEWETEFGIVIISPTDLLRRKGLSILIAKDKDEYYLNLAKRRRKKFRETDYKEFKYEKIAEKGIFTCKVHSTRYLQDKNNHLNNINGCPKCVERGLFYNRENVDKIKDRYGKVYVIRMYNRKESFYKVGITGRKDGKRFDRLERVGYKIEVIYEKEATIGEAFNIEQHILHTPTNIKYKPQKTFGGETECFSNNPLGEYLREMAYLEGQENMDQRE